MGKSQRRKGHQWEREIAKTLRELDPSARRVLEYQEGLGYDIHLESLPLLIQAKSQKKPNFIAALHEAVGAKKGNPQLADRIPLAVCKVTNKGEYAIMVWEDFIKIARIAFTQV